MPIEITQREAHRILDKLPERKLMGAMNYLRLLDQLPENQLSGFDEVMESLGWSILAAEAAGEEWQ